MGFRSSGAQDKHENCIGFPSMQSPREVLGTHLASSSHGLTSWSQMPSVALMLFNLAATAYREQASDSAVLDPALDSEGWLLPARHLALCNRPRFASTGLLKNLTFIPRAVCVLFFLHPCPVESYRIPLSKCERKISTMGVLLKQGLKQDCLVLL